MTRLVMKLFWPTVLGLFAAQWVEREIIHSGEVDPQIELQVLYGGGMETSARQYEANRDLDALSAAWDAPTAWVDQPLSEPWVQLDGCPEPILHIPADGGTLSIGPLADPSQLDPAKRHDLGRFAAWAVLLVALCIAVFPLVRRIKGLNDALERWRAGDKVDAPEGDDPIGRAGWQLNQLLSENGRMVDMQKSVLQAVAHELRTPIQRLRFRAETVSDPQLADAIDGDLDELEELTGEVLDFIRLERMEPQLECFNGAEEVRGVIAEIAPLHDKVVRIEGDGEFDADRKGFRRVARNLLLNAVRYAEREVVVEVFDDSLCVSDDGPGVPKDQRQHIFEPFARAESHRSRESGGVGLGLAIVQRIVQAHGGEITMLDGSTFDTTWSHERPH